LKRQEKIRLEEEEANESVFDLAAVMMEMMTNLIKQTRKNYKILCIMEVDKDIWDALHISHEGGTQEMFDRLMIIVGKIEDLKRFDIILKLKKKRITCYQKYVGLDEKHRGATMVGAPLARDPFVFRPRNMDLCGKNVLYSIELDQEMAMVSFFVKDSQEQNKFINVNVHISARLSLAPPLAPAGQTHVTFERI
ncbi:hypothetical protein ACJX0J_021221, partial [Zea mays]